MIEQSHVDNFSNWFNALLNNMEQVIKGKRDSVGMALTCFFAEGHVLLEDVPGTGKTTLAKSLAHSLDGSWRRVQFTPDLLPSDVTGGMIYNQAENKFDFRAGPVFANVVLADEINRASPKTQSSLLEVMEEQQITVDGTPYGVPRPFVVIATQNPIEQAGTYRLPEAQLDRFLVRISLGYPEHAEEVEVVRNSALGVRAESLQSVLSTSDAGKMIEMVRHVHVSDPVSDYIVRLVAETRTQPEVTLGSSSRGAIALMRLGRVSAAAQGRTFVTADDVKALAVAALSHRIILTPDSELKGVRSEDLIHRLVSTVAAPDPVRSS